MCLIVIYNEIRFQKRSLCNLVYSKSHLYTYYNSNRKMQLFEVSNIESGF
jgi:hypothetical protein